MAEENTPLDFSEPVSPLSRITERNRAARTKQAFSTDRQNEFSDPSLETFALPPKQEQTPSTSAPQQSTASNQNPHSRKPKAAPATKIPTLTDLVIVPVTVPSPIANVNPNPQQQHIDTAVGPSSNRVGR